MNGQENTDVKISRGVYIEIQEVVGKCFFMRVYTKNTEVQISNSSIFGNDAPNIFLKTLKELESCPNGKKYLRWEGESESYIWILDKKKDVLDLEIWLGKEGSIMVYEGEEALEDKEELIFSERTSYRRFVENVKKEFCRYFREEKGKRTSYEIKNNFL